MDNQKLCMSCMRPLSEEDTVCPHCKYTVGRQNPAGYLPAETLLQEHYIVGRALGSYGDACIYMGYDKMLKSTVFIREFFPADFCERTADNSVLPVAGKENSFDRCRESFYMNARALAKLKDLPALLPLYDIFTANDTVYAIYDYCEGRSLSRELKARGGRMPWTEVRPLFMQLMTSVAALHRAGVYHLAISPETILVDADGKLRLRSFAIAEARRAGSPIKPRFSPGFAAPEQYTANKPCGAPADVYGLAATIFTALTGNVPPEAPRRAHGSQDLFLPAEVADELPEGVGLALFNALQTDPQKRLQSVEELRSELSAEPAVNALLEDAEQEIAEEQPKQKKNRYPLYIGISVFVVLAVLAGILLCILFPQGEEPENLSGEPTVTTLPTKPTTTYVDTGSSYSIPPLTGQNYYTLKNKPMNGDFKLEIAYMVYDDKAEKGTIISQEPAAGTAAEAETVIKVVISIGSEKLTVPDVSGWPQEYATKYLEAIGLKVDDDVLEVNVSEYEKGLVEGTEPKAGTKLSIGDTITLRVSNVEPTTTADTDTTDPTDTTNTTDAQP